MSRLYSCWQRIATVLAASWLGCFGALVVVPAVAQAGAAPLQAAGGTLEMQPGLAARLMSADVRVQVAPRAGGANEWLKTLLQADVEAVLRLQADADQTVSVGFPSSGIKDIAVSLGGQALPVGQKTVASTTWSVWDVALSKGQPAEMRIRYRIAADQARPWSPFSFTYPLHYSRLWQGPVGRASVTVQYPWALQPTDIVQATPGYRLDGGVLRWEMSQTEPESALGALVRNRLFEERFENALKATDGSLWTLMENGYAADPEVTPQRSRQLLDFAAASAKRAGGLDKLSPSQRSTYYNLLAGRLDAAEAKREPVDAALWAAYFEAARNLPAEAAAGGRGEALRAKWMAQASRLYGQPDSPALAQAKAAARDLAVNMMQRAWPLHTQTEWTVQVDNNWQAPAPQPSGGAVQRGATWRVQPNHTWYRREQRLELQIPPVTAGELANRLEEKALAQWRQLGNSETDRKGLQALLAAAADQILKSGAAVLPAHAVIRAPLAIAETNGTLSSDGKTVELRLANAGEGGVLQVRLQRYTAGFWAVLAAAVAAVAAFGVWIVRRVIRVRRDLGATRSYLDDLFQQRS